MTKELSIENIKKELIDKISNNSDILEYFENYLHGEESHKHFLNKCMDISQQAGSKRKSVSEIKNILCAILHSFQYEKLNNTTAAFSSL